jgi:hypothetical protein
MSAPRPAWLRGLLLLVLGLGVLGFGALSLCGAVWSFQLLPAVFSREAPKVLVILAISVPCLLGGFFLARGCLRAIRRLQRPSPPEEQPHE